MNHFAKKCFSKSSKVNNVTVESSSSDDIDDDDYFLTINSDTEYETINNYAINTNRKTKNEKKLFATFEFQGKPVKFQPDSGATWNIIPVDLLPIVKRTLKATRKVLKMYNNDIVKPFGQCSLRLQNPTNEKIYDVEFVVVNGCTLILGNLSIQKMDLVRVEHNNIMSFKDEQGGTRQDNQYTVDTLQKTKL